CGSPVPGPARNQVLPVSLCGQVIFVSKQWSVKSMAGRPMVLDIETIGQDWDSLAPSVQTYLLDRAKNEAERDEVPEKLGLHPGTGRVVAISTWYPDENRGNVLLEGNAASWAYLEADVTTFR